MKNVLVSTRPSYQRLLMKLSWALLRRSNFFLLLKVNLVGIFLSPGCVSPGWVVGSEQIKDGTLDLVSL